MDQTKLIIHCITYNHAKFLRDCLDGFVMQKTSFKFQAWIADDCSNDGTSQIIEEYANKYPDIIIPVKHDHNLGPIENFVDLASRIKAEYVALCEGDDFWTYEYKLQEQVDYLDAHPECAISFHPVKVFFEDKSKKDAVFPTPNFRFNRTILDIKDLLEHNFIQTNSVVYRWRFNSESVLDIFPKNIIPGDYFMHLLHAQKGTVVCMDKVMSSYRRHSGGIWIDSNNVDKLYLKYGTSMLNFSVAVEKIIAIDTLEYHQKVTVPIASKIFDLYLFNEHVDKALQVANICSDVLSYKDKNILNKIKVTLFGFIPLFKIQRSRNNNIWIKLFNFLPIIKIKR